MCCRTPRSLLCLRTGVCCKGAAVAERDTLRHQTAALHAQYSHPSEECESAESCHLRTGPNTPPMRPKETRDNLQGNYLRSSGSWLPGPTLAPYTSHYDAILGRHDRRHCLVAAHAALHSAARECHKRLHIHPTHPKPPLHKTPAAQIPPSSRTTLALAQSGARA